MDRCMSAAQRLNFETYIKTEFLGVFNYLPYVEIKHDSSQNNGGLQVTDFIVGSFGYKYNNKRLGQDAVEYTKIIQDRIVLERNDLFKK